jgi:hypothetical protein
VQDRVGNSTSFWVFNGLSVTAVPGAFQELAARDAGGVAIGVAPGVQWIAVKIFDDRGRSRTTAIHSGFQ